MAPQDESARKRVRVSKGPAVLSALLSGAALGDIAAAEHMSVAKVQKLLRDELRKRWIAPAQDYARLQIARLETIAQSLKERAKGGDLPTIDRLLKVMDRLDRYHGFNKFAALSAAAREDVRAQLAMRLDRAADKTGDSA